jgi:hypothetical protein
MGWIPPAAMPGGPGPPAPGGGGGGGGGGGAAATHNPYNSARWASSMLSGRRRMAPEVYWQCRTAAGSIREWLSLFYPGARGEQRWVDLWGCAENIDLTLQMGYEGCGGDAAGYAWVCNCLATDDRLEAWLSRLAGEIAYIRTGEKAMLDEMQTSKPPGASHLAPDWALSSAREAARVQAMQRVRVRGGGSGGGSGSHGSDWAQQEDEGDGGAPRRRARRPRGGGGASGGAAPGGKPNP